MENESLLQRGVDFSLLPDNIHAFIWKMGGELTPDNDKSWKIVQKILFSNKELIMQIYNYCYLQQRSLKKYFCIFLFQIDMFGVISNVTFCSYLMVLTVKGASLAPKKFWK